MKNIGEEIYNDAVSLEKKFWDREDYGEEDIPLLSNMMDFIELHKVEFINYFNNLDKEN